MFVDLVHAVATPNAPQVELAAHDKHGTLPVSDHVVPASHGTLHTASVVLVHAIFTPCVHVTSAAHAAHGAFPVGEKVVPASHATWHTVSAVVLHEVLTPAAYDSLGFNLQLRSAAHDSQGSLPFCENEVPPTQGAIAPLHTMSAPGTQEVLTPVAHVESAAHGMHGAFPEAE